MENEYFVLHKRSERIKRLTDHWLPVRNWVYCGCGYASFLGGVATYEDPKFSSWGEAMDFTSARISAASLVLAASLALADRWTKREASGIDSVFLDAYHNTVLADQNLRDLQNRWPLEINETIEGLE